ncbi:S24 family peptidase [Pseudomonas aeruginosa]|uniref:S24 family peptidase n=1 Tax=Pseudomonas aeruginosa TaxID=287 RepID=UPI00157236A3|nr:helix-turn-helix transcriptional regulator [Pseudomonas aeruginosa]
MDIREVRRHNLKRLMDARFGTGTRGAQSRLADLLGKPQNFISRCLASPDKPGAKTIGEDFAREIEDAFQLSRYALDAPTGVEQIDITSLPAPLAQKIASYRPLVSIECFDVAGSMGPGTDPPDLHNVVDSMTLDAAWVRQNLVYTSIDNIKLISGRGDSMSPTIKNGDPLLVDVGITAIECDAIYFFMMAGQLHIKRIQRHLDGLSILSDNDRYRPIEVAADREGELNIFAQVIYGWNGQKF